MQFDPSTLTHKLDQTSVGGLVASLAARVLKSDIETSRVNAVANPSATKVASTQALKDVDDRIPTLTDLIDDSSSGTENVWSADKVISYIASVDDSEYFNTLADRDTYIVSPERDGLIAYVMDASADPTVGTDDNDNALGAIYVRKSGAWVFMKTLGYREVSLIGYLKESDIVNDYTTGGATKPLAAQVAVELAALVTKAQTGVNNMVLLPEVGQIVFDSANSTNTIVPTFKPKGQIVDYQVLVIDSDGEFLMKTGEVIDDNGVMKVKILNETNDFSANKALVTYLHIGEINGGN